MIANELRIGNWVKMSDDAVSSSEYPGTVFQWDMAHFTDLETCHLYIDAIEPIPITEEVLLKCGFDGPFQDAGEYFELNKHRVYLFASSFEFEFNSHDDMRFNLFKSYRYLHQLQNLYFALTGEELTYTP